MAVTVEVGGTDRTYYHWYEMNILDVYAPSGDVLTMPFTFSPGVGDSLPMVGQLVRIKFTDSRGVDEVLFAGPITEIDFTQLPGSHDVMISAEDLTKRMDSKLVSGVFTENTVEEMVAAILDKHAPSFKHTELTTFIEDPSYNPTSILPKIFDWKRVSEVLQEIAEEKYYNWYVDFNGEVIFRKAFDFGNTAPLAQIQPSVVRDDDDDGTFIADAGDFRFTTSINQLINTIFIKEFFFWSPDLIFEPTNDEGNQYPTTGFQEISGLVQPQIQMLYRPTNSATVLVEIRQGESSIQDDPLTPDVVEGVWKTYPVVGDDNITAGRSVGTAGTVYVNGEGLKMVAYNEVGADTPFLDPSHIRFSYRPIIQPTFPEISLNVHSIQQFAELENDIVQGDGEYQLMIGFGDLEFGGDDPRDTLLDYVNSKLEDYAWPLITGTFTVYYDGEHNIGSFGWKAGQRFEVLEPEWNLFDYERYWLSGQTDRGQPLTCWITSVNTTAINPETLRYDISFSSRLGRR